jgi:hypothetical protein
MLLDALKQLLDDRRSVPLRVTACIGQREGVMNLTLPTGR